MSVTVNNFCWDQRDEIATVTWEDERRLNSSFVQVRNSSWDHANSLWGQYLGVGNTLKTWRPNIIKLVTNVWMSHSISYRLSYLFRLYYKHANVCMSKSISHRLSYFFEYTMSTILNLMLGYRCFVSNSIALRLYYKHDPALYKYFWKSMFG